MKYILIILIISMIALFGTRRYKNHQSSLRHIQSIKCVDEMRKYVYMDYISVGWCFYHGYEGYER